MSIKIGDRVVTEGPGFQWQGRFVSVEIESCGGRPIFVVVLRDAISKEGGFHPTARVLCYAYAKVESELRPQ